MLLSEVKARKIKDSRGGPTIEVSVNGQTASAPAGKSVSKSSTPMYNKSIDWNIKALNSTNFSSVQLTSFDDLLLLESFIKKKFKLSNAKKFGANPLFAFETAALKAYATSHNKQLWQLINPKSKKFPVPVGNAIGGGLHSHNEGKPTFQEFLIIPKEKSISQNYQILKDTYAKIKILLRAKTTNDEGAWQTSKSTEEISTLLHENFPDVRIGVDVAASSFFENGRYYHQNKTLDKRFQILYINSLIKRFKFFYIEDPLEETDFSGFAKIKQSRNHLVVGDDLTATQIPRLKKAIKKQSINAIIIKPNQNGSLLELRKVFELCKGNKIKTIISHRSGETLDTALADLAFGFQANFIKAGIATPWRESKLKRLIEIEEQVNS